MKKLTSTGLIGVALAASALALTGCSEDNEDNPERTTFSVGTIDLLLDGGKTVCIGERDSARCGGVLVEPGTTLTEGMKVEYVEIVPPGLGELLYAIRPVTESGTASTN